MSASSTTTSHRSTNGSGETDDSDSQRSSTTWASATTDNHASSNAGTDERGERATDLLSADTNNPEGTNDGTTRTDEDPRETEQSDANDVQKQASSSSSIPKPIFPVHTRIGEWEVRRELGRGGFGAVYQVRNLLSHARAAAKVEFSKDPDGNNGTLPAELVVLRRLQWSAHACRLLSSGVYRVEDSGDKEEEHEPRHVNVVIMSLVGWSLSQIRKACPEQRLSRSSAIRVGIQCLAAIRDLHNSGYVHRDIKSSNFCVALPLESRRVVLIDFGFARRYLDWTNDRAAVTYRSIRRRPGFVGTDRYASYFAHGKLEQGRRDDIWSFMYMLVELLAGRLPWRDTPDSQIPKMKREIPASELLDGCPGEMLTILAHIERLEVRDRPNYEKIENYLRQICERCGIVDTTPFDWEKNGRYADVFADFRARASNNTQPDNGESETDETDLDETDGANTDEGLEATE